MTHDPITLANELAPLVLAEHVRSQRRVIGIAGESGSGKSVTATQLAERLTALDHSSIVLHQDDYFLRPPRTNHDHRVRDLASVGPQEVDLARLADHVASFRAAESGVEAPAVDYPGNRFITRLLDFASHEILIVEGTYVLTLADLDVRIFLEATSADTRQRRLERDRDIDAPIVEQVLAIEHELIAPQIARSDILIDRDFRIVRSRRT